MSKDTEKGTGKDTAKGTGKDTAKGTGKDTAKRPRDGPGLFKQELGLSGREWTEQWAKIRRTVHRILARRNLLGSVPSVIKDPAHSKTIGDQVESIHLRIFAPIKPSVDRRKLVLRIVAYEMEGVRRKYAKVQK